MQGMIDIDMIEQLEPPVQSDHGSTPFRIQKSCSRILGVFIIGILCLALFACDIFILGHEERYNPLDPDNKLVEVRDKSLPITRDGYVMEPAEAFFDDSLLIANWDTSPFSHILIEFDTSQAPDFVNSAVLEFYATSVCTLNGAEVLLVAEPWEKNSVSWTQIESIEFIDTSFPMSSLEVFVTKDYASCDVTEYVQRMIETGRNYGFLLRSWSASYLEFESSRGANPPRLRVWGLDIPD
jgi:hypothetical protein